MLRKKVDVHQLVSDQHVGDPQREGGVRPRANPNPLLRPSRRAREACVHLHEPRPPLVGVVGIGEGDKRLERRPPRFEQRSAEGEDEVGSAEVVAGLAGDPVHGGHDRGQAVVIGIGHVIGRADRTEELCPEFLHRARAIARHQRHAFGPPGFAQRSHAIRDQAQGAVPCQRAPLAGPALAHARHRRREPLRMIEHLHARDPPGAHSASTHGV